MTDHRPPITPGADHRSPVTGHRSAPLDTVTQAECLQHPSADRAQCQVCHTVVAGGAIVTEPAGLDEYDGCHTVHRTVYCPHCRHLQTWIESATDDGRPTGMILSGPGHVRGRTAVERFLRKHPESTGVLQQ